MQRSAAFREQAISSGVSLSPPSLGQKRKRATELAGAGASTRQKNRYVEGESVRSDDEDDEDEDKDGDETPPSKRVRVEETDCTAPNHGLDAEPVPEWLVRTSHGAVSVTSSLGARVLAHGVRSDTSKAPSMEALLRRFGLEPADNDNEVLVKERDRISGAGNEASSDLASPLQLHFPRFSTIRIAAEPHAAVIKALQGNAPAVGSDIPSSSASGASKAIDMTPREQLRLRRFSCALRRDEPLRLMAGDVAWVRCPRAWAMAALQCGAGGLDPAGELRAAEALTESWSGEGDAWVSLLCSPGTQGGCSGAEHEDEDEDEAQTGRPISSSSVARRVAVVLA